MSSRTRCDEPVTDWIARTNIDCLNLTLGQVLRLTDNNGVQGAYCLSTIAHSITYPLLCTTLTPSLSLTAVFDGVGRATWEGNFALLARKATIV
jgi:hypothetical protein